MSKLAPEIVEAMKAEFRRTGRLGGLARAKNMTAEQRRKSALKASRAAAESRKQAARLRKLVKEITVGTKALERKTRARLNAKKAGK